jgi:hypothetical protein
MRDRSKYTGILSLDPFLAEGNNMSKKWNTEKAEYRTIRKSFWHDPFIEELDAKGKLFYLYLFTCSYTDNFGIVEVSRKKISFETGLSAQDVEKYLADFEAAKKIVTDGGRIWLVNFIKNQTGTSPRSIDGLARDAPSTVPTKKLAESICSKYPQVYGKEMVEGDTYAIPTPLGPHTFTYACPEFGTWKLADRKEKPEEEGADGTPPCPHQAVLDAYHEILPELPKMKTWGDDRQDKLRTRWRERWTARKYRTQSEGIAYFRRLFAYIRDSDFLMGRTTDRYGKSFVASLDWIVLPRNFAKIIEGRYHDKSMEAGA